MGKVVIVLDVDPDSADEAHETGLTEDAYLGLGSAVSSYGDIIEIRRGDD